MACGDEIMIPSYPDPASMNLVTWWQLLMKDGVSMDELFLANLLSLLITSGQRVRTYCKGKSSSK